MAHIIMKGRLYMTNKDMAIALAKTDSDTDVVELLKAEQYWDNPKFWQPFGGNENNYSIIGNQQGAPDAALVEKLVNSIDAVLMKECKMRNIDITSLSAPQSTSEAMEQFFGVKKGSLLNMDRRERGTIADNVILAATGQRRGCMNLSIIDRGEGQSPETIRDTILSISKNNKLRIPFVQGKFNMGGTGAFEFCGTHHLQLIITKRCPEIKQDNESNRWAVTVVRKEKPREGRKSSMYTYLTDANGGILSFEAEALDIIPSADKVKELPDMTYGTFIKLFNYQIPGYKSSIILDLYYRLSLLLPKTSFPIRINECRKFSKEAVGNTTVMSGISTRMGESENILEDDFPFLNMFHIDGQTIICAVYVLKEEYIKNKTNHYKKSEGILYVVNGQTHVCKDDKIFELMGLSYISRSMLVILDCSHVDVSHQEQLFMTSRDRLREGSTFCKIVKEKITEYLKGHPKLLEVNNKRRKIFVKEDGKNEQNLHTVFQSMCSRSKVFSKLFVKGTDISSPFQRDKDIEPVNNNFVGKESPTFFKLIGEVQENGIVNIHVPEGEPIRLRFETDANNTYFGREENPGIVEVWRDGQRMSDIVKSIATCNGKAKLELKLPENATAGNQIMITVNILDALASRNFENSAMIIVDEAPAKTTEIEKVKSKKKAAQKNISMPNVYEVTADEFELYDMTDESSVKIRPGESGNDYFINMDNKYLLAELKGVKEKRRLEKIKEQYKTFMIVTSMNIENYYKNAGDEVKEQSHDVCSEIASATAMQSRVIVPTINMLEEMALSE